MRATFRSVDLSGYGPEGLMDLGDDVSRIAQVPGVIRRNHLAPRDRGNNVARIAFRTFTELADAEAAFIAARTLYAALLLRAAGESLLLLRAAAAGPIAVLRHAVLEQLSPSQVGVTVGFSWRFVGGEWLAAVDPVTVAHGALPTSGGSASISLLTLPAGEVLRFVLVRNTLTPGDTEITVGPTGNLAQYVETQALPAGWSLQAAKAVAASGSPVELRLTRTSTHTVTAGALEVLLVY